MTDTTTPPDRPRGHPEAFALMLYACDSCGERETLWNTRDGVTPFIIRCRKCAADATHAPPWSADKRAPDHRPRYGDRVFVDLTDERRRFLAARSFARMWAAGQIQSVAEFSGLKEHEALANYMEAMCGADDGYGLATTDGTPIDTRKGEPDVRTIGIDLVWLGGAPLDASGEAIGKWLLPQLCPSTAREDLESIADALEEGGDDCVELDDSVERPTPGLFGQPEKRRELHEFTHAECVAFKRGQRAALDSLANVRRIEAADLLGDEPSIADARAIMSSWVRNAETVLLTRLLAQEGALVWGDYMRGAIHAELDKREREAEAGTKLKRVELQGVGDSGGFYELDAARVRANMASIDDVMNNGPKQMGAAACDPDLYSDKLKAPTFAELTKEDLMTIAGDPGEADGAREAAMAELWRRLPEDQRARHVGELGAAAGFGPFKCERCPAEQSDLVLIGGFGTGPVERVCDACLKAAQATGEVDGGDKGKTIEVELADAIDATDELKGVAFLGDIASGFKGATEVEPGESVTFREQPTEAELKAAIAESYEKGGEANVMSEEHARGLLDSLADGMQVELDEGRAVIIDDPTGQFAGVLKLPADGSLVRPLAEVAGVDADLLRRERVTRIRRLGAAADAEVFATPSRKCDKRDLCCAKRPRQNVHYGTHTVPNDAALAELRQRAALDLVARLIQETVEDIVESGIAADPHIEEGRMQVNVLGKVLRVSFDLVSKKERSDG